MAMTPEERAVIDAALRLDSVGLCHVMTYLDRKDGVCSSTIRAIYDAAQRLRCKRASEPRFQHRATHIVSDMHAEPPRNYQCANESDAYLLTNLLNELYESTKQ